LQHCSLQSASLAVWQGLRCTCAELHTCCTTLRLQITRQLLPLLSTLGSDPDTAVCHAAIEAASDIATCLCGCPEEQALFEVLDSTLLRQGHVAELAILEVFAPLAASAGPGLLEWLLLRLQLMLAAMHQRATCGE